jgi:hypothetical protein
MRNRGRRSSSVRPHRGDAAWDAVRRRDAAGFRHSTSMGWNGRRSQTKDPDAAAWQALAAATVTLGTVAVGVRIDDAEPQGVPPPPRPPRTRGGDWGVRAPLTVSAPPRRRWSNAAQRVIRPLRRRAGRRLRWVLAHGRCWVRVGVHPEHVPTRGDRITMHLDDLSRCLKSPPFSTFKGRRG